MAKIKTEQETAGKTGLPFTRENYFLMGAALAAIILGYILLGSGDITMAPILLVLGYCVLFPIGIIWGGRKRKEEAEQT
jgi:Ca2+/Na+ antiporter